MLRPLGTKTRTAIQTALFLHDGFPNRNNNDNDKLWIETQVGQGDEYQVTVEWFDTVLSTLGDSLTGLNGMKFSTK